MNGCNGQRVNTFVDNKAMQFLISSDKLFGRCLSLQPKCIVQYLNVLVLVKYVLASASAQRLILNYKVFGYFECQVECSLWFNGHRPFTRNTATNQELIDAMRRSSVALIMGR